MKSVVISGAAGGIGMETVRSLVKDGYVVYAGYMDDWEAGELDKLKAELRTDLILPVLLDVRQKAHIEAVFARVETEHPDLAGVIGNGAAAPLGVVFEHMDFEVTRDAFETNFIGNATLAQRSLKLLKKTRGRIIFVGSMLGKVPVPPWTSYSGSKHALEALCAISRRELKQFGIDVVMINPGVVKSTYMTGSQLEQIKEVLRKIGTAPEKLAKESYDCGKNSKLKPSNPIPDPNYEKVYLGLSNVLRDILPTDKMKIICNPVDCAKAIMKGLTAPRPKVRYIVGGDAKIMIFLTRVLPERWMDKILASL